MRVAAAILASNVGAWVQRGWVARTKGGREEVVDGIRADERMGSGRLNLSAPSWRPLLVRKRARRG